MMPWIFTNKRMVFIGLFLFAWLLAGCATTGAGAAEHYTPLALRITPTTPQNATAIPTEQEFLSASDLAPDTPSPTLVSSPAISPTNELPTVLEPTATITLLPLEAQLSPTAPAPLAATDTPQPVLGPEDWKNWPVVPTLSQTAKDIYLRGQALGRDPHHFSKIGDCQNITTYFLSHFEDPSLYRLGDYAYLQPAIDWFMGSFARESLAVKGGLNVAAVLSPLRANPQFCSQGESPLACEYRLYNPSFAIISMEEAWSGQPEKYGTYMRQVIEYTISQNIVPVIATKADDLEGGDRINAIIAQLAYEYDIPLWNFWAAAHPLSNNGLIADGFHLTHGNNFFFDVPVDQRSGYTMRNLTALQVIDAVWKGLTTP